MKMDDTALLAHPPTPSTSPEVFQQLGAITRQLHDTLAQLGVTPKLQQAAEGLPDARSRLIRPRWSTLASQPRRAASPPPSSPTR
jgi:chemotaxis protein CheZ